MECVKGYRARGRFCVEDGDVVEKAGKISELIVNFVCEANARSVCDGVGALWVNEVDMLNNLDKTRLMDSLGIEDSLFPLAKQKALQSIYNILETRRNFKRVQELKCPDLLVKRYKSYACRMREWLSEHVSVLMPVFAALVGCTLVLQKLRRRRLLAARVEELYQQVCETLEEIAMISRNSDGHGEPWVVASWLRDHLLLPKERKNPELWKMVEELVQEDSRLDRYPKLVKGEAKVVWEWQGGSLSSSRKKKKGVDGKSKLFPEETPPRAVSDQDYSERKPSESLH
uniref:Man1/Src1-like C-terminal domain-containing protein n=1 Tax=Kalanchoe fedtschenkoi TaxID=63787 RepID=A0A7N0TZ40_KALFE